MRAAVTTNKMIEGDDISTFDTRRPTQRLGNYTQIFGNTCVIPDTDEGLNKAGRAREMAYQMLKTAKEQKLDIEATLFANQGSAAGNSTTARAFGGIQSWITVNVVNQGVGGANPADTGDATDPIGNGTGTRTAGTGTAFAQADFDSLLQSIWTNGGKPDTVYISPANMATALTFTGNNNQRSTVMAKEEALYNSYDVYVTPWGSVTFKPSRYVGDTNVFVAQSDMWAVGVLRPTKSTDLAKTGDATKKFIRTELTLISKNEKASGLVVDIG